MKRLIVAILIVAAIFLVAAQYAKYFPDIIVTSADGIWTDTRGYTSLSAAVAAIVAVADNRDLWIVTQETQAGNLTIPSYVNVHFICDGEIYMSSGTLTMQTKSIQAPDKQVFNGGGSYDFATGTVVKNVWFPSIDYVLDRTTSDEVIIEVVAAQTMTDDRTLGGSVTMKWAGPNNIITITPGKTLTVDGTVIAGKYQIFDVTPGVGGVENDGIVTWTEYSAWFGDPYVITGGAATQTPWVKALDDETAYSVRLYCFGQEVGGAGRATYGVVGLAYRDGGGAATLQGGATGAIFTAIESDSGWDCDLGVNGNNLRVEIDGDSANDTNWSYELHILAQDGS